MHGLEEHPQIWNILSFWSKKNYKVYWFYFSGKECKEYNRRLSLTLYVVHHVLHHQVLNFTNWTGIIFCNIRQNRLIFPMLISAVSASFFLLNYIDKFDKNPWITYECTFLENIVPSVWIWIHMPIFRSP